MTTARHSAECTALRESTIPIAARTMIGARNQNATSAPVAS